ncbi:MAG: DNA alkylation repair protein [Clostridia bacterium]|nr:DNA alkylation repair protein [Clostridia bacterium]
MDKYLSVKKIFELNANKENAIQMSKYMRNMFEFYGLPAPKRKEVYDDFIKSEKKAKMIDWEFLDECYKDNHREFQYLVFDYLLAMKKYAVYEDIFKIKKYILDKSWWDTIDFLCKVIGDIGVRDIKVKDLMLDWSKDENIWLKRTAIEHQLGLKEKTDTELLKKIVINNFGSNEFFVNKAIGWALRDYSKTNPEFVKDFINTYKDKMNSLSIKEASKYI